MSKQISWFMKPILRVTKTQCSKHHQNNLKLIFLTAILDFENAMIALKRKSTFSINHITNEETSRKRFSNQRLSNCIRITSIVSKKKRFRISNRIILTKYNRWIPNLRVLRKDKKKYVSGRVWKIQSSKWKIIRKWCKEY